MTREQFERFVSGAPHHRRIERFDHTTREVTAQMLGHYWDYGVQLAWDVLMEEERRRETKSEEL
jgi:hypothetical protein